MQPQSQRMTRLRQLIPVGADGKLDFSILNTYVDAINNLIPLTANINTINRNHFRKARARRFLSIVDEIIRTKGKCDILDVGGTLAYWQGLEPFWRDRPVRFTLVNVESEPTQDVRFHSIAGDGRALDQFQDQSFDVVHSNSVIEHVGGWGEQWRMAREIRRLAPRYFVQTPNFWFPLEPHFRAPFIHWLPEPWRVSILMRWACGFHPRARSVGEARQMLDDARLVDARAMRELFPDAVVERERFAGFTKSLIAVR